MKKKFAPIQKGRVFTFALHENKKLPVFNQSAALTKPAENTEAHTGDFVKGETLFWKYCGTCHVVNEGGGGLAPDLAYSAVAANKQSLLAVVKEGGLLSLGVPTFGDRLTEKDIMDIQKYILTQGKK